MTATVELHASLDAIEPADWDALVARDHVIRTHAFLRAVSRSLVADLDVRYLLCRGPSGAVRAHTFFYSVTVPVEMLIPRAHWAARAIAQVRRVLPRFLAVRVVGCGPPTGLGNTLSFAEDAGPEERAELLGQMVEAMEAFARERGAAAVMIRDLRREDAEVAAALSGRGYTTLPNLDDTALEVRWPSFDAYLGSMKARYRKLIELDLAQAASAGVRVERVNDLRPHAEAVARLFAATAAKHTAGPVVGADYFHNLGEHVPPERLATSLFWMGEKLVAFNLCFLDATTVTPAYVGIDYAYNDCAQLLFNTYYEVLRVAIEGGKRRIRFGRTAYVAKMRLGAELEPLALAARFRFRPLAAAVAAVMRRLIPRQETPRWHVFKAT